MQKHHRPTNSLTPLSVHFAHRGPMGTRPNPVRTMRQPSLFGKDTSQVVNWRQGTPFELRYSAQRGLITADELAEMEALVARVEAEDDLEPMWTEGVSRPLAHALVQGLVQELMDLDHRGYQNRVQDFLAYWRVRVEGDVEQRTSLSSDEHEQIQDEFFGLLEENARRYTKIFRHRFERQIPIENVTDDQLFELLSDPEMYSFKVVKDAPYGYEPQGLWRYGWGRVPEYHDGAGYDDDLLAALKKMTERDLKRALVTLATEGPYFLEFDAQTRKAFVSSFEYNFEITAQVVADFDVATITEALKEAAGENIPDDVVFRYAGTNATVAGASARGMYVAALRPGQLRGEGAALGICVGRSEHGYKDRLAAGEIKIYSIRTEAGRPKFTISMSASGRLDQVKGKANRLPGFEPGKDVLTKPDEVRAVVEFLLFLGYTPDQIRDSHDIRAGVRALEATGVDPFSPPPVRTRVLPSPRSNPTDMNIARRLAQFDYAHPWGGRWGV